MAKHADIVVPSTTAYEREDYSGGSRNDPLLVAMRALTEPYAASRDDYDTFAALAERLGGVGDQFTQGRTARQWLQHMYEKWAAGLDFAAPTFDQFWADGQLRLPTEPGLTLLSDFRADPHTHRLNTPRVGASRSSRPISMVSVTPTAWAIRPGSNPPNGSAALGRQLPAAPAGQPARIPPAQPARHRRTQPGIESVWARTHPDAPPRGCRRTRSDRRRRGAGVQRPGAHVWPEWSPTPVCAPPGGPAVDGCLVRPAGPGGPGCAVCARQPERAHRRCRDIRLGAGLHRRARAGAGGEVRRAPPTLVRAHQPPVVAER